MGGDMLAALDQLRAAVRSRPPSRAVLDAVVVLLAAAGQAEAAERVRTLTEGGEWPR